MSGISESGAMFVLCFLHIMFDMWSFASVSPGRRLTRIVPRLLHVHSLRNSVALLGAPPGGYKRVPLTY
jgi:hypothetical protein